MVLDAHHHLWKYDPDQYGWIDDSKSTLRQDFLLPQLRQIAADHQVDGFVAVQARQCIAETRDLLGMAESEPLIRGVVGWLPIADKSFAATLTEFADHPQLVALRHVVQDEPDDFLDGIAFNAGIEKLTGTGLVYDLLIYARQLPAAIRFVDRHPGLPIVLDHIAKPTIDSARFDQQWKSDIEQLARRSNVVCKFSGVATEVRNEHWNIDTIRPYWDVVLECFTPQRLMYGSDWPVCTLRTDYGRWLSTVQSLASALSDSERDWIFAQSAMRAYSIKPNEANTL